MKYLLFIIAAFCLGSETAAAQYNGTMSKRAAEREIQKILTDDITTAAKPLNNKLDYITTAYDEGELKDLIRNYEKTNRKVAAKLGKDYVPYDRRIDVSDPQKVKRYFHKRIDIIF